jgi:hypothetical protein
MLRSMQTTDPATAWSLVHPELLKLDADKRISGVVMNAKLGFHCRGMQVVKKTLHWALDQKLLVAHFEEVPTAYSLTTSGRDWTQ